MLVSNSAPATFGQGMKYASVSQSLSSLRIPSLTCSQFNSFFPSFLSFILQAAQIFSPPLSVSQSVESAA